MQKEEIKAFFDILAKDNPNPKGELFYTNPFTLLVAVVLSARATDKGVNKATKKLFEMADTPQNMLALGEEGLKEHVKTIGLYNTKAKNIIALSKILINKYKSEVPSDRDALEALPGVGRKTANVVLNIAFKKPVIAVDTHIFRVSNRTGLAYGKTPLEVEKKLMTAIPENYLHDAHHWLILLGRYICKARIPECYHCKVVHICRYDKKNL